MSRRDRIRESALADPASAATVLNDTLMNLYERLEAVEGLRHIDCEARAAASVLPAVIFQAPAWPVGSVSLAKLYNLTDGQAEAPTGFFMWEQTSAGIRILPLAVAATSARYAVRFEIRRLRDE